MSYFTQYRLKDGRKIRGRYDPKSAKVCISRSDLEGLIYEADVAYEQAEQLQTIIENLEEIKRQAVAKALDKIRAEIDEARFIDKDTKLCKNVNASGLEVAMQIIDRYKAES